MMVTDAKWDTNTPDVRNCVLQALEKVRQDAERQTGLRFGQLCTTGRILIEYYRRGLLRPHDDTFEILIPDRDRQIVQDFLATWDGKIVPVGTPPLEHNSIPDHVRYGQT